ncbi:MAG TPA: LCP family protein [Acidimicrobiales bacterium]
MSRARHFSADSEPHVPQRRRSWKQRIILTTGCVLTVLFLGGASVAGYVLIKYNSIERYDDLDITSAPPGEPENYLVVGSDSRGGVEGRRTDTIMIVRVDPAEEQAAVLSLQRDLVVPIAGTGERRRINAAYSMGSPDEGRQRLIDTIRENFAIEINHYVEISFEGFGRLVDAVGGVPLYFPTAVRDRASGLFQERRGCVSLNGEQALQFVRARHLQFLNEDGEWESDLTGDLGRVTRQQVFIETAVARTMARIRSSPGQIAELIDIGVDTVGLDDQITIGDIRDLADRFRDFDPANLRTYQLAVIERGDGATLDFDRRGSEQVLNVFRGLAPGEISPGLVAVTVLNGSGQQGQANDVAGALQAIGFDVVGTGNVPEGAPLPRTQVHYAPGDEAAGQRVARHITGGAEMVADPNVEAGQVELWTGTDFTTVHSQPTPIEEMATTTTAGGAAGGGATTTTAQATTTTTEAPSTTTTLPPEDPEPPGRAIVSPC